jgi:hypothetical protein
VKAPLRVLASEHDFVSWRSRRSLPMLAKLHGSIGASGQPHVEPIVSDFVELHELSPARRAALAAIAEGPLLITGYSGGDGDCYQPLLEALGQTSFRWVDPSPAPRVEDDVSAIAPDQPEAGLAVEGLRGHPALARLPPWPADDVGAADRINNLIAEWTEAFVADELAEAYARMLVDARQGEAAAVLSLELWRRTGHLRMLRHFADARFNQGGADQLEDARHPKPRSGRRVYR